MAVADPKFTNTTFSKGGVVKSDPKFLLTNVKFQPIDFDSFYKMKQKMIGFTNQMYTTTATFNHLGQVIPSLPDGTQYGSVQTMADLLVLEESIQLVRMFSHPNLAKGVYAITDESIWTKGKPANPEVLHLHEDGSATLYNTEGKKSESTIKWTAKKAQKKGWTKVAEGPSRKLLHLINAESLAATTPKPASKNKEDFLKTAKEIIPSWLSYYGIIGSDGFSQSNINEFAGWYNYLIEGQKTYFKELTPAQKGKITAILNRVHILYCIAVVFRSFMNSSFNFSEIPLAYEAAIDLAPKLIPLSASHYFNSKVLYLSNKLTEARKKKTLIFDPNTASFDELRDFAVKFGAKNIECMGAYLMRSWVNSYLQDNITSGYYSCAMIEKLSKTNAPMAEFVSQTSNTPQNSPVKIFSIDKEISDDNETSEAVYKFDLGNQTVILPTNAYATQHPKLSKIRVYLENGDWLEFTKGENPVVIPKVYDISALKAKNIDVSCGWNDITPLEHIYGVTKPKDTSDLIWNLIKKSECGGKAFADFIKIGGIEYSDKEISETIVADDTLDWDSKLLILASRESIRRLAVWASKSCDEAEEEFQTEQSAELLNALALLAKSGAYVHPETAIWYSSDLDRDYVIPPGGKVHVNKKKNSFIYVIETEGSFVLEIDNLGRKRTRHRQYTLDSSNYDLIFTAPENSTLDKAHAEGWEFDEAAFESVLTAEQKPEWGMDFPETLAAYKFKIALNTLDNASNYQGLISKIYAFPPGVKELLIASALDGNTEKLDVVLWRLSKKAYASALLEEKIDPTASYYPYVQKGMLTKAEIGDEWSASAIQAFVKDFHLACDPNGPVEEIAEAIADKLLEIKKSASVEPSSDASKDTANLDLTPIDMSFGGMHTKQAYADPYGNVWMAKFYASDKNAQYRCDAEHYGNVISRTFGFGGVQTFVRIINGNYNILQLIEANKGTLKNVMPGDLTLAQLIDVMQEHVLDWAISNHDSWGDNLLLHPEGTRIIGIDKGQAFKHVHDDELAIGYLPRENPIPVWYDFFYQGVIDGTISKEIAQQVASRVLLKAYHMQSSQTERMQSLVEAALSKRTIWPQGHDKDSYAKLIMDRKANLLKDFEVFYRSIFEQANIEWTIDTEQFGKNVGNAFISNSPIFAEKVRSASAFGVALLFDTPDLEDIHIMFTTIKQAGGGTCLLGNAKIREDADKRLTAWLKAKLNENKKISKPVPMSLGISSDLPYLNQFIEKLINLVKTASTHKNDGQYNKEIIQIASNEFDNIQALVDVIENQRKVNPTKLASSYFTTLEHQDVWYDYATELIGHYLTVTNAIEEGKSAKDIDPDFPTLEFLSYTPTEGLQANNIATTKEIYTVNDPCEYLVSTTDGGFYKTTSLENGISTWISHKEYLTLCKDGSLVDNPSLESEKDVQIAGKQMLVARRKAASHGGMIDFKTGKLIQMTDSFTSYQTGYDYIVSYNDVKIYYRPWMEEGVERAQQGHLYLEIKNWAGDYEAIDDVLDTLGLMGVDVSPADTLSLELFYWRHLTKIIKDRISNPTISSIINEAKLAMSKDPNMAGHQELEVLKDIWAKNFSSEIVNNAIWMPHFSKHYGSWEGRPYWYRPDVSLEDLEKYYKSKVPVHYVSGVALGGRVKNAGRVLQVGQLLSTEERPRVLGIDIAGMSSSRDQSKGSSAFVFTRQNYEFYCEEENPVLLLDPRISLRTHTYAFPGDHFGEISDRINYAHFTPNQMFTISGGNEMMVKNEASVWLIIVYNSYEKDTIVEMLQADGVFDIDGIPLDKIILTKQEFSNNQKEVLNGLWERAKSEVSSLNDTNSPL